MGVIGSMGIGWDNGGPAACVYGWVIASCTATCIALSMAEIISGGRMHCPAVPGHAGGALR